MLRRPCGICTSPEILFRGLTARKPQGVLTAIARQFFSGTKDRIKIAGHLTRNRKITARPPYDNLAAGLQSTALRFPIKRFNVKFKKS